MGWTFTHRESGTSTLAFFNQEWSSVTILDIASRGAEVYMAVRGRDDLVFGVAIETAWRHRDYHNFGYKDHEEGMGPYLYNCPARILDLLSPVESLYTGDPAMWAARWRDECRKRIASRKAKPKLKAGMTIRLAEPLRFKDGRTLQAFYVRSAHPLRLTDPAYPAGAWYRVPRRVLDEGFEVVNA